MVWFSATVLALSAAFTWWMFLRGATHEAQDPLAEAIAARPTSIEPRRAARRSHESRSLQAVPEPAPENKPDDVGPPRPEPAAGANASPSPTESPVAATPTQPPNSAPPVASGLAGAERALAAGDWLGARATLVEGFAKTGSTSERSAIRERLLRVSAETLLSPRILPNDPLVERYVVQAGDHLERIASQARVSPALLARINNLPNMNMIRIGQTLKVIKGPFRAVVDKSDFRMDVYLGDVLVRSYPVGLGADDSTPTGEWQVLNKLRNPTYYPPRGGQIMAADDPQNPLGEYWIGLVGTSGEAVGQERYGIHGTIEPESIGKNASMGCIRLRNDDIEELYGFLVERQSTVTVTGVAPRAASSSG